MLAWGSFWHNFSKKIFFLVFIRLSHWLCGNKNLWRHIWMLPQVNFIRVIFFSFLRYSTFTPIRVQFSNETPELIIKSGKCQGGPFNFKRTKNFGFLQNPKMVCSHWSFSVFLENMLYFIFKGSLWTICFFAESLHNCDIANRVNI